ncbi:hypothetical protein GC089_00950 [Cellulomonas sp. JZ18]|uniref:hypothetical protein n=1 Tax=Cellulomonas sp. JZ18 TaxID=2654191 RepID=UPI0012D3C7A7|nr:hypothetical protein [Cellulomonas sp. JZ18]QGQ18096.1 hypothetical protein GC089_00950 [Cellulomonas sp. JZ18]
MSIPGDDLPRAAGGWAPRPLLDERTGRPVRGTRSRAYDYWPVATPVPVVPVAPARRGVVRRLAVIAVVAAVCAWTAVSVLPPALQHVDAAWLDRLVVGRVPEPTPEVAALADEMFLTQEGRELLYRARPQLLGAAEFAGHCGAGVRAVRAEGAVGCYRPASGTDVSGGSIVVYVPADARLHGFVVETTAHELLHAAWDELTPTERGEAAELLRDVVAGIDPADPIHAQIAGSVGGYEGNRPTEHFAYVGSQVWREGGLHPRLEALYGRYVAHRAALVEVSTAFQGRLDRLAADADAAVSALSARRNEHAQARAQLAADVATLDGYRSMLEQEETRYAAMPPGEQARSRLGWTWRDGTRLPMAAASTTLGAARGLLVRDEAEMAVRAEALRVAGEELAAEEARVEALVADVEEVLGQLDPGT